MNKKVQEEMKILRGWIAPKQIQIHEINQEIETQELLIKQTKENIESGFYLKQANKDIAEQITKFTIEAKKLEKERLIRDMENNYYVQKQDIQLRTLQGDLKIEQNILEGINDKITKLSRNHKVEKSQDKETEEIKATADFIEKEEPSEAKEWNNQK